MHNLVTNFLLFGQRPGYQAAQFDEPVNFPAGTKYGDIRSLPVQGRLLRDELALLTANKGRSCSDAPVSAVFICPRSEELIADAGLLGVTPEEICAAAGYFCGCRKEHEDSIRVLSGRRGDNYIPEMFCFRLPQAFGMALGVAEQATGTCVVRDHFNKIVVSGEDPDDIIRQAERIKSALLGWEFLDLWQGRWPDLPQADLIEKIKSERMALLKALMSDEEAEKWAKCEAIAAAGLMAFRPNCDQSPEGGFSGMVS